MNILIVEDEKTIRKALMYALQKEGYTVSEAHNPVEAFKYLDSFQYHLIIENYLKIAHI